MIGVISLSSSCAGSKGNLVLWSRASHMFAKTFHNTFFACIFGNTLFDDSVNTDPIFDTQFMLIYGRVKGPPHWHWNGNSSCLAWCFLAIASETGDALACVFLALEVWLHSTLACTLQRMHATQKLTREYFLQCEGSFMCRRIWHSQDLRRVRASVQPPCCQSIRACALTIFSKDK